MIREYGDSLACVIMEPLRSNFPSAGFLEHVRDEIHRVGGLLIFDEISAGWRCTFGGAHKMLGVNPDMATFSKAMGNGHPIGAVVGTKEAMDGAQKSFISSTYWTEAVGPTAALATIEKMEKTKVWEHADGHEKIANALDNAYPHRQGRPEGLDGRRPALWRRN